jgi:hypothetical protein
MSEKIKYEIEFPIQASEKLLFQYISSPSGLSEWFADNVNYRGEIFIFIWDGAEESAKLLSKKIMKKFVLNGLKMISQILTLNLEFNLMTLPKMFPLL